MNSGKKSFLLHIDSLDILDELTNEESGALFKAIKSYQKGEDLELSGLVRVAFSPFKNQFTRDNERYDLTCKRRAEAGSKGGKAKVANASKCKQELAKDSNTKQDLANLADNKNKNKNKTNNKSVNDLKHIQTTSQAPNAEYQIFEYWRDTMNKGATTKPTAGRISKIKARLKDGYTVDQIKSAIDGCKSSDHNMGRSPKSNPEGRIYDCLTLICRNSEKLEMFIGYTKVTNTHDQELEDWINDDQPSIFQGETYDHE